MKKKLIKRIAIFLCAATALTQGFAGMQIHAAEYWPDGVSVESQSAVIMEEETGTILYSKNMDNDYYPASITKIMTALVVLENCDISEKLTFSEEAVYLNEGDTSHIARNVGEEMTVEETLYGMMLESANECAWALGEHVAGDMDSFVKMMNEKAKELGCTNTHFNNPNGLPDDQHYTTAHDMALISRAAYAIPKFKEIVGTKRYTIPPTNKHSDPTYLNNHHNMLSYYTTDEYLYDYCTGGKTGYTTVANSTLVTYAEKDGMTLVCVVMNVRSPGQYLDTRRLFDYCFDNFAMYNVSEHTSIAESDSNVTGLLSENIDLIKIDKDDRIVLPKTASFLDAKSKVSSCKDDKDDSVVGKISYNYADREVGTARLHFSKVNKSSYPFDNIPEKLGGSGKEYIRIDYIKIGLVLLGIIVIVLIILYIKSKELDIIRFKLRVSQRHPKKEKSLLPTVGDRRAKRRRRRK